ncbi:MAG: hypothetical protein ACLFUU_13730 [Desulfobacteraceae bacterium]
MGSKERLLLAAVPPGREAVANSPDTNATLLEADPPPLPVGGCSDPLIPESGWDMTACQDPGLEPFFSEERAVPIKVSPGT